MGTQIRPNNLLRDARLRLRSPSGSGRTLSRQELADRVNSYLFRVKGRIGAIDANYIGKLERGIHRWPNPDTREALRSVLMAPADSTLGFYISRGMAALPATTGPTARDLATISGVTTRSGQDDMQRRTVLTASALVAARALFGGTPASSRSGQIGFGTATHLRNAAHSYRRAYRAVPAAQLLPAARAHMNLALSLDPSNQPKSVQTELVATIGEMAALCAALLALDLRRHTAAATMLDTAWQAARAIGSAELQAVVLGTRSFVISDGTGDHRSSLQWADKAREIASRGACAETQGWVAAVASERCASLGDMGGCQRRLSESASALTRHDPDATWLGIGDFNQDKLRAYEGGNLVRLGRYREAEPILTEAIDGFADETNRHRGTALIDRAEARAGAGDLDAACDDATSALGIIASVQHLGNLARIEAVARLTQSKGTAHGRLLMREAMLVRADAASLTLAEDFA